MRLHIRNVLIASLLSSVAVPALWLHAEEEPTNPEIGDLAWLAGTWRADSDGSGFEEHWTAPWGGTMAAVSREVSSGKTGMVELSSIESVGDDLVLHLRHFHGALKPWDSEVDGPLSWTLAESAEDRVVFSDPEQTFPRTITYERDGDVLRAILEGGTSEKPMRMAFELERVDEN